MKTIKTEIKESKMGTTPVGGLIAGMAAPAMFSMVVQTLYSIVDSFFVARISQEVLTAIPLAFPIQSLLMALGVGTDVDINSLVSRCLGEGRRKEASSAATHGLLLGLVSWALFALFGLFFARQFIEGFSTDPTVTADGTRFAQIVPIFSLGVFAEINVEKTLQATGNTVYPTVLQLIGVLTSLILGPIFIFDRFGVPAMGVPGAAIADVLAQCIAMCASLTVLMKKRHEIEVNFRGFHLDFKIVRDIYAVGVPTITMQPIASVMVMGMNLILVRFTDTAVALFGICFKLQSFVFMPVFGLTQGMMPTLGYNYGTKKQPRTVQAIRIGLVVSALIMAAGVLLFWAMPARLLLISETSPEMAQISVPALQITSLYFVSAAVGITFSTVFQALSKRIYSLAISPLRQMIVLLLTAHLLTHISLNSVWYVFPIAEVFSLAASLLLFRHAYRGCIRTIPESPSAAPVYLTADARDQ